MPDHIFISYRREDAADATGRINDRLRQHFGAEMIFTDVDDIPMGVDFRAHLDLNVSRCKVLLAVVGRGWLTVRRRGWLPLWLTRKRRLNDPDDWVRIEIESALRRKIRVIPLLVQGAKIPSADELPDSLRELAFRQGTPIQADPFFHADMDRLIKGLDRHFLSLEEEEKPQHDADEIRKYEEEKYALGNVTGHELRAHLRRAGARSEVAILDQAHITVDLSSFSHKDKDVHYLPVDLYPTVSVLLEDVYFRLKDHVPPYTYGTHWILRDKKSGKVIQAKKLEFRDSSGPRPVDNRPLTDEGIIAGTQLLAVASPKS